MVRFNKLFGIIRIILGLLFLMYPTFEFFNQGGLQSEKNTRWLFVFIFFLIYAYSAVRNGLRELAGNPPAFNLSRFFEASLNGFISVYLIILIFATGLNSYAKFLLALLAITTLLSMIRDIRILSMQYYERKQRTNK